MLRMLFDAGFGSFLRKHREDLQISLRQLAKDTGLDPAYLSRVERELSPAPRSEIVNQIADALCRNQGLSTVDCERLRRQLLEVAGQLVTEDDLIDDLSSRFADKLREMKMPEAYVLESTQKVTLDQMRKVLIGEEPLEIRWFHDVSAKEIKSRRSSGEEIFTLSGNKNFGLTNEHISQFEVEAEKKQKGKEADPVYKTEETPTSVSSYIKEHASEFTSTAKPNSQRQKRPSGNSFRAGNRAHIEVKGELTLNQQEQLRTISQLIKTILEEK